MAPITQIVKIGALLLSQFGLLVALNFQLFGMITAYKMMELKRNLSLAAYISSRKTYFQRKRNLQARQVRRKRRSVWVINGRTDQWWQNMIGEDVPGWCWEKNFRMTKDCFLELANELCPFLAPNSDSPNHRVSVDDSECLRNSSVYSIQAHTLSVRDDQYDTGTKVLTLTKEHWRNAKKSFRV